MMATPVGKSKIMSLKSKKKHIKTVTQKVKLFRAKDPLMSVFMWGVSHTVSGRSNAKAISGRET